MIAIANLYKLNIERCLDNIAYKHVIDVNDLNKALVEAAAIMLECESKSKYVLLIVDSATSLFKNVDNGRRLYAQFLSNLNRYLYFKFFEQF